MSRRARPPTWLSKRLIVALLAVAMQVLTPFQAALQARPSGANQAGVGLARAVVAVGLAADIPICSDHAPTAPSEQNTGDHPVSCTWCQTCCPGVRPAVLPGILALPEPARPVFVALGNYEPRQPQGPPPPHPNARAPPPAILA